MVAVIAGGAGHYGFAVGKRLVEDGWDVILADKDRAAAFDAAQRIGKRARGVQLDVTDLDAVKYLAKETGPIGALVNAAGGRTYADVGLFCESSADSWKSIIDLHLRGVLNTCHAFLPGMISQHQGAIISLAAVEAFRATPRGAAFSVAKAGVVVLTQTLVRECQPHGVRINAIVPGNPESLERSGLTDDSNEVAEAVAFLASIRALRTTGATLDVSSGWALH